MSGPERVTRQNNDWNENTGPCYQRSHALRTTKKQLAESKDGPCIPYRHTKPSNSSQFVTKSISKQGFMLFLRKPVSKSFKHPRCGPNQVITSIPLSQDSPPSSRLSNNNFLPLRTHGRSATFHGTCFRCWSYLLRGPSLDSGS